MKNSTKKNPKPIVGLDKNAYLDAKRLYFETGDVRYLVIAIGRPGSSHKARAPIARWIIEACENYADNVCNTPPTLRKQVKHSFTHFSEENRSFRHRVALAAITSQNNGSSNKSFRSIATKIHLKKTGRPPEDADLKFYDRYRANLKTEMYDFDDEGSTFLLESSQHSEEQFIKRVGSRRSKIKDK